jgi:hypothetical protein
MPGQKESIKKALEENKKENTPLAAPPKPDPPSIHLRVKLWRWFVVVGVLPTPPSIHVRVSTLGGLGNVTIH